jgi:ComF family protein
MTLTLLQDFLNLIFLNGCYACGQALGSNENAICLTCFSQMEETHFHRNPQDNELYYKFAGKVPLTGATSLFYFDKKGRVQKALHALKYQDQPQAGKILGQFWGEVLKESSFLQGIDMIIPVPLHPRKEVARGYNQSEVIAQGLHSVTGIPVGVDALKRVKKTDVQARKSRWERWGNVENAFQASEDIPKGVLLIDDVITTGATTESCLSAIMKIATPPTHLKVGCVATPRLR